MKKTVKKLDNNVIKALTVVCELSKQDVPGFVWLTHSADYANFPGSLVVTCVFNTQQALANAQATQQDALIRRRIHKQLLAMGVLLKDPKRHVQLDSEEACLAEHSGNWQRRLMTH